ncbi:MAG TPA: 2-C-methyl-D-erythritol 2,4-cyclodiphosphate synthase [Clostridiaceae bacterium]|nr:2-C-methyl-D-erythritol 2,4-cyclodiphosphate synthase [Clostridiaceae bacterium]
MFRVAIGQDSHRFTEPDENKRLILGGVVIEGYPGLKGNSDADVVLHAITNAISGISCVNILGKRADDLCHNKGITDSAVYLKEAIATLGSKEIIHVSISIEALIPKLSPYIESMRKSISALLGIDINSVGITATSGEGLTEFGKGNGIFCTAIITARETDSEK